MIHFYANHLPQPVQAYVAWVDTMGTHAALQGSVRVAANFMLKPHIAALTHRVEGVHLFPVMDGFYAACVNPDTLATFVDLVFQELAAHMLAEAEPRFWFLVRAAIAQGEIIRGDEIVRNVCHVLDDHAGYRSSILLGKPMADAHEAEGNAPPFGIAVHDSAAGLESMRGFGGHLLRKWWPAESPLREQMRLRIADYLERRAGDPTYPEDARIRHGNAAAEYYG